MPEAITKRVQFLERKVAELERTVTYLSEAMKSYETVAEESVKFIEAQNAVINSIGYIFGMDHLVAMYDISLLMQQIEQCQQD